MLCAHDNIIITNCNNYVKKIKLHINVPCRYYYSWRDDLYLHRAVCMMRSSKGKQ